MALVKKTPTGDKKIIEGKSKVVEQKVESSSTEQQPTNEKVATSEPTSEPTNEKVIEQEPVNEGVDSGASAETSESTEVVATTKSEGTEVTAKSVTKENTPMKEYLKEAEQSGFEGMTVGGFGTFPTIVIDNGSFVCDKEEWKDTSFIAQIQSAKPLFLCNQVGVDQGDCGFTYDKVNLTNPVEECATVAELKAFWEEAGETMEIKEYREVVIEIVQEGHEFEGEFFIAKIPPSSVNAFNGQVFIVKNRTKCDFNEVKLEFSIGKSRGEGTKSYKPWKFRPVFS